MILTGSSDADDGGGELDTADDDSAGDEDDGAALELSGAEEADDGAAELLGAEELVGAGELDPALSVFELQAPSRSAEAPTAAMSAVLRLVMGVVAPSLGGAG